MPPRGAFVAAVFVGFFAFSPAGLAPPALAGETVTGLQPVSPQPAPDALNPGLAVRYYFGEFDFMWEMERLVRIRDGQAGKPVPAIDTFNAAYSNDVLTAGRSQGVGALLNGLLYFDEPGLYYIAMWSNDGVRLEIGGQFIFEDPDKHSNGNRLSPNIPVEVPSAGWYPININYFQKKGTWALDLLWFKPGEQPEGEPPIVPAEAYAHLPETSAFFVPAPKS